MQDKKEFKKKQHISVSNQVAFCEKIAPEVFLIKQAKNV